MILKSQNNKFIRFKTHVIWRLNRNIWNNLQKHMMKNSLKFHKANTDLRLLSLLISLIRSNSVTQRLVKRWCRLRSVLVVLCPANKQNKSKKTNKMKTKTIKECLIISARPKNLTLLKNKLVEILKKLSSTPNHKGVWWFTLKNKPPLLAKLLTFWAISTD